MRFFSKAIKKKAKELQEEVANTAANISEPQGNPRSSKTSNLTGASTKRNTRKNKTFTDAGRLAQSICAREAGQRQGQANTKELEAHGVSTKPLLTPEDSPKVYVLPRKLRDKI
jgi:hypothetical protein